LISLAISLFHSEGTDAGATILPGSAHGRLFNHCRDANIGAAIPLDSPVKFLENSPFEVTHMINAKQPPTCLAKAGSKG